jgi:hypothetical protein
MFGGGSGQRLIFKAWEFGVSKKNNKGEKQRFGWWNNQC